MKRLLPILLCLALLSGCTAAEQNTATQPQETAATQAPSLVSLYDSAHSVEQQTAGAVRAYQLGQGEYSTLLSMGDSVVAVSADGILTAVRGVNGEVAATGMAELPRDWDLSHIIANDQGVLYFAQESREIVALDLHLQPRQRSPMPEDSQGDPLLQSGGEVFYCKGSEIWALNLQSGISRLVRQHSYQEQTLTGSYFDDTTVGCRVKDDQGREQTLYLLSKTGEVIRTDMEGFALNTRGRSYFATGDGQYVFGSLDTEPMCLYPVEETTVGLPEQDCAIGYISTETGLRLACYDLSTGKRTAQVDLPVMDGVTAIAGDGTAVWLLAGSTLYRWEITANTGDETVYTGPRYSAENPDTEGLAQCQEQAQQISQTYGLELYIWNDAAASTKAYGTKPEYRVSAAQESLDAIEALLKKFPADFLPKTGKTVFYLVQSLENGEPAAQYWDGTTNCVVLDTGAPAESFLWGLGFGVDTRVLGNSRDFDTWDDLNPKGFQYTFDYETNAQREDADKYLDAFINQRAMSFRTEDRSYIFAYAILPEGQTFFENKTLQKKLTRLCEGIREAYDWEDSPEIFPWEQFLEEPLAKEA